MWHETMDMTRSPRLLALACFLGSLAPSGCGDGGADDLMASGSPPGVGGSGQDASTEAAVDSGGQQEAASDAVQEVSEDSEPDVVVDPVPDPFVPPDVEVATWKGKLPPGGFFDLKVEVTRPTQPPQGELYPLVVFAHGFQIGEDMYQATMTHIAKFGYVAVSVDYDGSLVDQDHFAPVEAMGEAIDMVTKSPPAEVGAIVDANRVAAMGHSLGGKGAVWLALEDPRIGALVALDPVDDDPSPIPNPSSKRPSLAPERMGDLKVPSLFLGGALSPTGQQACAPLSSNACRFFESVPAGTQGWMGILENFGHMQFLDPYDCFLFCGSCERGPEAEHEARQVIFRGLAVALLEYGLRGELGYLDWLEGAGRGQLEADGMLFDPAEQGLFCTPP